MPIPLTINSEIPLLFNVQKHIAMTTLRTIAVVATISIASVVQAQPYPTSLYQNEQQITTIINQMTLEEKIEMLHGKNMFSSAGVPRLGIADIEYADGPFGIREELEPHSWNSLHLTTDSATFFPTGSALAATWSTEWAYAYGRAMSREARLRGKDMILGPAMNIQRIPTGGRTYEYLSEDPILSGMLSVGYTRGAQCDGTAVCLKHFALNNQENYRGFVDVRISDRAMHEIYLRPFEMAIREADAWGVMAAYNKVNGRWCSENEMLLNTILRQQWHFPGMVISDWGGVHSTVDAVTAGLNVEMPGSRFMGKALLDSVKAGKVSEDVINQRVREILRVRMAVKPIAKEEANSQPVGNAAEMTTALEVARRSIVLLKNEGLLPIDPQRVRSIAVIGGNAVMKMALGGVGAGVKTRCEITPLEGLQKILGDKVKITYNEGYKSYGRENRNKKESPVQAADRKLMSKAVKAAKRADLVIFFAGDNREVETEGSDRETITLPSGQDELAAALAKANNRLVTVIISGGPVDVSTVSEVSGALLASWFNGSMGGQALAEVLAGEVSPSGKLPMTWPRRLEDVPAYATASYPQKLQGDNQGDIFVGLVNNQSNERRQQLIANYAEEAMVGYRWYDSKNIPVAYPFGHGLSYAKFEYDNLLTKEIPDGFDVGVLVTNDSDIDAEEVVQVYVSRPGSSIERPKKELKGFQRVALKAGEKKLVIVKLRYSDLYDWDEATQQWKLEPGRLILHAGGSSDNLPLEKEIQLEDEGTCPIKKETTAIYYNYHTNSGIACETSYSIKPDSLEWFYSDNRNGFSLRDVVRYDKKDFDVLVDTLSRIPFKVYRNDAMPSVGGPGYDYSFIADNKRYLAYGNFDPYAAGKNGVAETAIKDFIDTHKTKCQQIMNNLIEKAQKEGRDLRFEPFPKELLKYKME